MLVASSFPTDEICQVAVIFRESKARAATLIGFGSPSACRQLQTCSTHSKNITFHITFYYDMLFIKEK